VKQWDVRHSRLWSSWGFPVITAVSLTIHIFCDMTPCHWARFSRHCEGAWWFRKVRNPLHSLQNIWNFWCHVFLVATPFLISSRYTLHVAVVTVFCSNVQSLFERWRNFFTAVYLFFKQTTYSPFAQVVTYFLRVCGWKAQSWNTVTVVLKLKWRLQLLKGSWPFARFHLRDDVAEFNAFLGISSGSGNKEKHIANFC